MAKRDYYKVLDVPKNATEAEIKKAYRRLAMKFHPDRNPHDGDAEEKFKEAKEAPRTISSDTRASRRDPAAAAAPRTPSATSSAMCLATSSEPRGVAAARRSFVARICASNSISISIRPCSARPWNSRFRSSPSARPVTAPGPRRAVPLRPATPAVGRARYACRRASFSCSRPVRAVVAPGPWCATPATPA